MRALLRVAAGACDWHVPLKLCVESALRRDLADACHAQLVTLALNNLRHQLTGRLFRPTQLLSVTAAVKADIQERLSDSLRRTCQEHLAEPMTAQPVIWLGINLRRSLADSCMISVYGSLRSPWLVLLRRGGRTSSPEAIRDRNLQRLWPALSGKSLQLAGPALAGLLQYDTQTAWQGSNAVTLSVVAGYNGRGNARALRNIGQLFAACVVAVRRGLTASHGGCLGAGHVAKLLDRRKSLLQTSLHWLLTDRQQRQLLVQSLWARLESQLWVTLDDDVEGCLTWSPRRAASQASRQVPVSAELACVLWGRLWGGMQDQFTDRPETTLLLRFADPLRDSLHDGLSRSLAAGLTGSLSAHAAFDQWRLQQQMRQPIATALQGQGLQLERSLWGRLDQCLGTGLGQDLEGSLRQGRQYFVQPCQASVVAAATASSSAQAFASAIAGLRRDLEIGGRSAAPQFAAAWLRGWVPLQQRLDGNIAQVVQHALARRP